MSDQSLPEGVERLVERMRFLAGDYRSDEEARLMRRAADFLSDLPKIVDQAKQEERERVDVLSGWMC